VSAARLRLPADLLALRDLGPWLRGLLDPAGAGELHGRLELALHEVCVNVVQHAYGEAGGTIDVSGRAGPGSVELTVTDCGAAFDAAAVTAPRPGVPQERGYGLGIVEQLVDELTYIREGEGRNRWVLRVGR
jgi:serine/threonine-protein kinase RsbW